MRNAQLHTTAFVSLILLRHIINADLLHAGQIAEVIDIPATMVGKLIGKAGETIKQLQYSTNTKVNFAHAAQSPRHAHHSCWSACDILLQAHRPP